MAKNMIWSMSNNLVDALIWLPYNYVTNVVNALEGFTSSAQKW